MLRSRVTTIVLIAAVTALAIHVIGSRLEGARSDVTADGLYSLSPGTLRILDRMQREGVKPIEVSLYFSLTAGKTLPKFIKDFITYERYLRHLLKEYERASGGRIAARFIDPVPDSDEAQDAADYGLDGKPINEYGDLFYFGLVFETQTGSRDLIDFLWPEEQHNIEYEISRRIHALLWPSKQRVGVLSSLEVLGTADNPYMARMLAAQGKQPRERWIAMRLLEQSHPVSKIDLDTDHISKDEYDVVVVIHPKTLPAKTLWALDEWIVTGGNALILLDPYSLDDRPPQDPRNPLSALQYKPSSELDQLLSAWGLERPEDRFAADFELAVRRPVSPRGGAERVIVDLAIGEENRAETLAEGHPALRGLSSLRFFLPGSLVVREGEVSGVELTPLITTTSAGSTLEIQPGFGGGEGLFFTDLNDAGKLRDRFSPGAAPVVLAYQVRGKLGSAFPEGAEFPDKVSTPPPGWPPGVPPPVPEDAETVHRDPVPEDERRESTVLVFADVDFISDQIAFQRSLLGFVQTVNDNSKLLLNCVDYLLGAQELMEVRSRSQIRRPFTLLDEIEDEAEKETLERERQIRADIEGFQEELREKQNEITQRNAALFQKRLQEEVDRLNEKIQEGNRELWEIRKSRRSALEGVERQVRIAVLGWMPSLVLIVGIFQAVRRRARQGRGPARSE